MSTTLGIIGGYLGSGKSTLVNRLLAGVLPGRTAVVVNDFGSVNIDAGLIAAESNDTIELTNGCICCQITDDAARTMTALAERRDLDHVLCEVSGVSDPHQLAIWQDFPGFSPGPVLVCADATSVRQLLRDKYVGDTVQRQFATADVVLVTKTDLVMPVDNQEAVVACREAAPQAQLVMQDTANPDSTAAEAFNISGSTPRASAVAEPDNHANTHESYALESLGAVDVDALAEALAEQKEWLIRAKGILQGLDGQWYDLQLSGGRVDVRPGTPMPAESEREALVLIASGPDAHAVLAAAEDKLREAARPIGPR